MSLADLRKDYDRGGLHERELAIDPITQFRAWFAEAQEVTKSEANAMTVATASSEGVPAARTVLLKGLTERGFVFYSNYQSLKGQQLAANPRAELLFYWPELERQVRVNGAVERLSRELSEAYFRSRPVGNQLGAVVSPQSQVIPDRELLEEQYAELERVFADGLVPMPEHWGGYVVVPEWVEFWQGRRSRLHDRLRYVRDGDGWRVERLAP